MAVITLQVSQLNKMSSMLDIANRSVGSFRSDLLSLRDRMQQVDYGICNLGDEAESVKASSDLQSVKSDSLTAFSDAIDDFIDFAERIDSSVSKYITRVTADFYKKYAWLKPESEKGFFEKLFGKIKKAASWCKDHLKSLQLAGGLLGLGRSLFSSSLLGTGLFALGGLFSFIAKQTAGHILPVSHNSMHYLADLFRGMISASVIGLLYDTFTKISTLLGYCRKQISAFAKIAKSAVVVTLGTTAAKQLVPGIVAGGASVLIKGAALAAQNSKSGSTGIANEIADAAIKGEVSGTGQFLGFDTSGKLAGELFGYSAETSFESGVKWTKEGNEKKLDSVDLIKAEAKAEAHLAKGSAEGSIGLLSGKVEGSIGQVAASGSVGISLYNDGKLAPQIAANLEASAVAATGAANVTFGTDEFNFCAEGKGDLLGAKANATVAAGVITTENADGTVKREFGAQAKVGAEAYLAKGEVSGGFSIFGIKFTGSLGGKAGAVGVKAEAGLTTGGFHAKAGLSAVLGVEIGIGIDWTGCTLFGSSAESGANDNGYSDGGAGGGGGNGR